MLTRSDIICYPSSGNRYHAYVRGRENLEAWGNSQADALTNLRNILKYYRISFDF